MLKALVSVTYSEQLIIWIHWWRKELCMTIKWWNIYQADIGDKIIQHQQVEDLLPAWAKSRTWDGAEKRIWQFSCILSLISQVTRKEEKVLGNSTAFLLGDFVNLKYSMSNKNVDTNIHECYCASLKIRMKKAAQDGKWLTCPYISDSELFNILVVFFFCHDKIGIFQYRLCLLSPINQNCVACIRKIHFYPVQILVLQLSTTVKLLDNGVKFVVLAVHC